MKSGLGLALLVTMSAASAWAQQGARLSVEDALDLAAKQNLDLVAARARRAVSRAGVQIARERPNPTISFGALRDSPHESLFIDQPLEIGGQRARRIAVANQEGSLADVEISALERQVRRNTREAYFQLSFAQAETERFQRVLELARRLEQIARDRFAAGDVAQLEVIQAALEVARAEADHKVAQQDEKVALSQLNALLNEPAGTRWQLVDAVQDLPAAVELPQLLQLAYSSNPELQHLAQEQKVEQSRRSLLKAERIPNIDFEFGSDFNSPPDFQSGPRGQIALSIPLFARNQGEIAQSLASERQLDAALAATKRSVAAGIETAFFDLGAQRTQAETYRDSLVPVASKLEALAEESYRAGKADILTVLTAQRNVQDVEHNYLQSLLSVQSSYAGLEELVGAPLK